MSDGRGGHGEAGLWSGDLGQGWWFGLRLGSLYGGGGGGGP